MVKIKFADNTELDVIQVNGSSIFYQNATRDSLEFVFNKQQYDLNTIDNVFSDADKVRTITIEDEQGQHVYNDYVLKVSIRSERIIIEKGDSTKPDVTEERVFAKVAQQTYIEKLLEQMLNK